MKTRKHHFNIRPHKSCATAELRSGGERTVFPSSSCYPPLGHIPYFRVNSVCSPQKPSLTTQPTGASPVCHWRQWHSSLGDATLPHWSALCISTLPLWDCKHLWDSFPVSRVLFSSGPTASPQNSSDRHQSSTGQSPQTRTAPQQSKSPVSQTTEQPPISPNPSALSRHGAPPSDLITQAGAHLAHLTQFSPRSLTHTHIPRYISLSLSRTVLLGFSLLSHPIKCLHSFDCM